MKRKPVPKRRKDYEQDMLLAFWYGMQIGYGIDHENITEEEARSVKEFAEMYDFDQKAIILVKEV